MRFDAEGLLDSFGLEHVALHAMAAAGCCRGLGTIVMKYRTSAALQEEHTLLSAAAVALSHAGCPWPLLLPVHDAVRDGYRGVAVVQAAAGAGGAAAVAGQTLKFDTDSLHSSRLPEGLLRLDQLLLLFAKQLAAAGAPAAAAACRAAVAAELEALPASMAADAAAARGGGPARQQGGSLAVAVAVRHCYALPSPGEEQGRLEGRFLCSSVAPQLLSNRMLSTQLAPCAVLASHNTLALPATPLCDPCR